MIWEILGRRGCIPAVHIRNHIDLGFCCGDLLLRRELGAATKEERHLV